MIELQLKRNFNGNAVYQSPNQGVYNQQNNYGNHWSFGEFNCDWCDGLILREESTTYLDNMQGIHRVCSDKCLTEVANIFGNLHEISPKSVEGIDDVVTDPKLLTEIYGNECQEH